VLLSALTTGVGITRPVRPPPWRQTFFIFAPRQPGIQPHPVSTWLHSAPAPLPLACLARWS